MIRNPADSREWIRNPSDEQAIAEGCWFDSVAARDVIDFVEAFCWISKGRRGAEPFRCLPWQVDFFSRLFGWKRADGTRRFEHFYVEIAKKNGKSTGLAALVAEELFCCPAGSPEIYINACDRAQAGIIFNECERMRITSPELKSRLKSRPSAFRIYNPANGGTLTANSRTVASKDGFNPTFTIFDELHRQPNSQMWDVFEYASAARENPLMGAITTAGEDCKGTWFEQRDYAEKVNRGEVKDSAFLGIVYRADPEDDIENPAVWRKANPALGTLIDPERFGRELKKAMGSPERLANFLRLRLNIVSNADKRFVRLDKWDACDVELSRSAYLDRLATFAGRTCYGGLDLSTTTDLTAFAKLFPGIDDDDLYLFVDFWCPGDNPALRERRDQFAYRPHAQAGWIGLIDGAVIDYDQVEESIAADAKRFKLKKVFADPWNATKTCLDLQAKGVPVEFLRQGFLSLSGPTKELERLILAGRLKHGGNPVLRWNAVNAIAERDSADNRKLSKGKSSARIDGLAAAVNALAAYLSDPAAKPSVYRNRGFLVL